MHEQVRSENGYEVEGHEWEGVEVVGSWEKLGSYLVDDHLRFHLWGEVDADDDGVPEEGGQQKDVVFMVELADADVQKDAVVIEFMDAALAFVAVSHSVPLQHAAGLLHADELIVVVRGGEAVLGEAGGVVGQYQVVQQQGQDELVVRLVSGDEG